MAQGELIGTLGFAANDARAFSASDIDLMEEAAEMLAIAIQQSRLFRAEQEARQTAETLQSANLSLTRTLQPDQVMEIFLTHLKKLIPYDSANVMLRETETRLVVKAVRGYEKWTEPEKTRNVAFDAETNPIICEVLVEQRAILIPDTRKHEGWERPPGSEHVLNWIGAPLVAGGKVIGLYSIDKAEPGFFNEKHVSLAEALAAQAAVAIENARLYEQAHRHAEELERRVAERTAELRRFVNLMTGREVRMAELKQVIRHLRDQLLHAGFTPVADDPLLIETEGMGMPERQG